jgi:hypothetical protein
MALEGEVVELSLVVNDELKEESKEMNLFLLGLADAGNALYLLEVEQGVDADVVVLLIDCVESKLSERLQIVSEETGTLPRLQFVYETVVV